MTVKIWLLPLKNAPQQKKQSGLARELLRVICIREGFTLNEEELNLDGLDLINLFHCRHELALSIAHCEKMLAVAIGPGRVGVDCEARGRTRNWQGMAKSFFTAGEADVISRTPPEHWESVFLRHWVLKEAYIKAVHGSIFGDLNSLFIDAGGRPALSGGGDSSLWKSWEFEFGGIRVALCGTGSEVAKFSLIDSVQAFADGTDTGKPLPCTPKECRIG